MRPGSYSYKEGKRELFADLLHWAHQAVHNGNADLVGRIVAYVTWASAQKSDELDSVVDLAFFLPMLRDPNLADGIGSYFPREVLAEKRRDLMQVPEI